MAPFGERVLAAVPFPSGAAVVLLPPSFIFEKLDWILSIPSGSA